jgi:hypothetical protein
MSAYGCQHATTVPGGAEDEVDQADGETGGGTHEAGPGDPALFDLEVLRKRLQISDILVRYVRDGARTLSEVQQAISAQDLDEIMAICDGASLRDVLMDGEHVVGTGCLARQPHLGADLSDGQAFRLKASIGGRGTPRTLATPRI